MSKREKTDSFVVTGSENIAVFFEHKNLQRFVAKGGRSSAFVFHKVLEGLHVIQKPVS